jgi:hypothetical protein
MISLSTASDELFGGKNSYISLSINMYLNSSIILDLGNSLYSFITVTGTRRPDGNMYCLDEATKHVQNVFLTHGCLQSCLDVIAHELFYILEFFERLDGISFHLNGGTFDQHFAYRITPTRTYKL